MPIYEYLCLSCKDLSEVLQKMNDRPLRKCKKCAGKLEKQVSRMAFQLKGDGWFASGYSKTSGKAGSKTSETAKSTKETKPKSGSSSDSKGQKKAAPA